MADTEFVKAEPEAEPAAIDEEELFDDAGDLEFYDKNAPANAFETLYLARIPRYMWEAWQKLTDRLGDDDEVQIGTLRTWEEPGPNKGATEGSGDNVTKLRMLLHPNCPEHQQLPREYDLDVLDRDVKNHYIFTEEDLPSYKAKNKVRQEALDAGIPAHLLRQKQEGGAPERRTYDRRSRFQPYYRKAIPSKRHNVTGSGGSKDSLLMSSPNRAYEDFRQDPLRRSR